MNQLIRAGPRGPLSSGFFPTTRDAATTRMLAAAASALFPRRRWRRDLAPPETPRAPRRLRPHAATEHGHLRSRRPDDARPRGSPRQTARGRPRHGGAAEHAGRRGGPRGLHAQGRPALPRRPHHRGFVVREGIEPLRRTEYPRRGRGDSSPRNIHVAAAASPATCLHGISTAPRRRHDSSPRKNPRRGRGVAATCLRKTNHGAAAASPRLVSVKKLTAQPRRRRDLPPRNPQRRRDPRLHGISTASPRRRRDSSTEYPRRRRGVAPPRKSPRRRCGVAATHPRNIRAVAAASPRLIHGISTAQLRRRRTHPRGVAATRASRRLTARP